MSRSNRAILASWSASSLPDTRVGMRPHPPGFAARDDMPRPLPPIPDLSPAEAARDAMRAAVAEAGGQTTVSAGAVHFIVGTMRLDFVMGLVGSQELLVRDLRAVEAMAKAALAALGVRS